MPDQELGGTRLGDLLEPYFGDYDGTLHWQTGTETTFSLSVPYEAGDPYHLYNVWECNARNVGYWSKAHVTTQDGAFDNDVDVSVNAKLPDAPDGAAPSQVTAFSGLADFQWRPGVVEKLSVNLERFQSSLLLFDLDWAPGTPRPTSGVLLFEGVQALDGKTTDTIQVGTLTFLRFRHAATLPPRGVSALGQTGTEAARNWSMAEVPKPVVSGVASQQALDATEDLPVVARLIVEVRSDGSRTVARGAMEDAATGTKAAIEATGTTPLDLALALVKSLLSAPWLVQRLTAPRWRRLLRK